MATGIVKFFNTTKGFGFIKYEDSEKEIFVHITGLKDQEHPLQEGERVQFEEEEGKKGLNAIEVERI